jgi:hypothetical protein
MIRLDTIQLRNHSESEFYPIVRTNGSFEPKGKSKKSSIIQFLLNDLLLSFFEVQLNPFFV